MQNTVMIACQVVVEEMAGRLPKDLRLQVLDAGLHTSPDRLRAALQAAIDAVEESVETILLGYGQCSRSVEGLKSKTARLVLPRVDDCIGIFLGSRTEYLRQNRIEPGTYFLSRGWVTAGTTPFSEYESMVARFGEQRAKRVMNQLLKHYKRLAYIRTGDNGDGKAHRAYALQTADRFQLRFEELPGTDELTRSLICGEWGQGFLIVPPGEEITYQLFMDEDE